MCRQQNGVFRAALVIIVILSLFGFLAFSAYYCSAADSDNPPSPEEKAAFTDFKLPLPQTEEEKRYLGVTGDKDFKISQIKTQVLIIEFFSNVCPHCNREAPNVNELYRTIEERPDLKDKVKLIGIGAGNRPEDNSKFRTQHKVPFPLFSDMYLHVAGPLGVLKTPTFIGVTINRDGSLNEFYHKSGGFGEVPAFLERVLKLSGVQEEE